MIDTIILWGCVGLWGIATSGALYWWLAQLPIHEVIKIIKSGDNN